jgi:hypothetical protein
MKLAFSTNPEVQQEQGTTKLTCSTEQSSSRCLSADAKAKSADVFT